MSQTASLNKQFFSFLEEEHSLKFDGGTVFRSEDVEIKIIATGDIAQVLDRPEVYIWHKQEPKCTEISYDWISMYWNMDLNLDLSHGEIVENYRRLSYVFHNHAAKVLYHYEEWLLPSMKIHFEWMFHNIFRENLDAMLTGSSLLEMYNYIKNKDPKWEPS